MPTGNPVDQIQENCSLLIPRHPRQTFEIEPYACEYCRLSERARGCLRCNRSWSPGPANAQNVTGVPKPKLTQVKVSVQAKDTSFYQIKSDLNAHGIPTYQGEASLESPNTWMPLTIESTMLASRLWDETLQQLERRGIEIPTELNLPLETILTVLTSSAGPGLVQTFVNPSLKSIKQFTGFGGLSDEHAALLIEVLGTAVDILNAVPITFGDPGNNMVMPIQGERMPLLRGNYGIRAMGIDTLFNVGSYAEPTRLRVVMPEADKASVTAASIGDRNGDGDADEPYESGTIYSNTTDGVMLTITVDHRSPHPASIWAEYMDANGAWQPIGEARDVR